MKWNVLTFDNKDNTTLRHFTFSEMSSTISAYSPLLIDKRKITCQYEEKNPKSVSKGL